MPSISEKLTSLLRNKDELLRLAKVWGVPAAAGAGLGALGGYATGSLDRPDKDPAKEKRRIRNRRILTALGALAGATGGVAQKAARHTFANTADFREYDPKRNLNILLDAIKHPKNWRQPSTALVNTRDFGGPPFAHEAELLARSLGVWRPTPGEDRFLKKPDGTFRFNPAHEDFPRIAQSFEGTIGSWTKNGMKTGSRLSTWPVFRDAFGRITEDKDGKREAVVKDVWDAALNKDEKIIGEEGIDTDNLMRWLVSKTVWRNPAKVQVALEPDGSDWKFKE